MPRKARAKNIVSGTLLKSPDCFQQELLRWYKNHGRSLPWRRTHDPYRIWVSEIMLQQTQVNAVIPYYRRFIRALPSPRALARAPLQQVLKLWEGMGYYARARNLHKAARQIAANWDGQLPPNPAQLQKLPGIGRSTAGAIASLAYGKRIPILDGNLKRLFTRLLAIRKPVEEPAVLKALWEFSEQILPAEQVSDFNQALMDLGAMVCTPRTPACPGCPVREFCRAAAKGIQDQLPLRTSRRPRARRHIAVAMVRNRGRILLTRRSEKGLLGGLWSLPEFPLPARPDSEQILKDLHEQWDIRARDFRPGNELEHTFTHLQVTYHPFQCLYETGPVLARRDFRWLFPLQISRYPLPAAMLRILNQQAKLTGNGHAAPVVRIRARAPAV